MPLLSPLTRSCPLSRLASSYRHRLIVPAISRPRTYSSEPPQITPDAALDPFYVTTPIFYVNAAPHVGHLHSMLLADLLARFSRLREPHRPVYFATGTDEHGQKIQAAAAGTNASEIIMCDKNSAKFKQLAQVANIGYTDFIRTTESRHYAAVQNFWEVLKSKGFIYKGGHSGWYAVSDECFYPASQVQDGPSGTKISIETGSTVVWTEEENYKFSLSAFRDDLVNWLEANPDCVSPAKHHSHLLRELRSSESLPDLSISRPVSRLSWGVPVPGDPDHTIYVWIDALVNYLTVLGYPKVGGSIGQSVPGWPANFQIVGKDIIRFHAIYWPALLLAHELPLPKTILVHSHWTMDNAKMSKSRGNVADPFALIEKAGVDSVRAYLLGVGGSLKDDSDYSYDGLTKHHKWLSDQIGNLLGRISGAKMESKISLMLPDELTSEGFNIVLPASPAEEDVKIDQCLSQIRNRVDECIKKKDVSGAFNSVMELVSEANAHYSSLQPWRKESPLSHTNRAYVYSHEALRITGILLSPYLPKLMPELLAALGTSPERQTWESAGWEGPTVDAASLAKGHRAGMRARERRVLFARIVEDA